MDVLGRAEPIRACRQEAAELRPTASALAESEMRFRALFGAHVDAVLVIDQEALEIVDANAIACVMYGYPRGRLIGMAMPELSAEPEATARSVRSVQESVGSGLVARLHRRRDGSTFAARVGGGLARLDGRPVVVAVVRDESEHTRGIEPALHSSTHDPLTALANRALVAEEADRALARADRSGASLALLFVDLDGFKPINETYGHEVGDEVLRAVADRLRGTVRTGDVPARVGGDEFVVLCPEIGDESAAMNVAGRMVGALAQPMLIDGRRLCVSACVGVVVDRGGSRGVERLLRDADAAVYRAKRTGPGSVILFSDGPLPAETKH